jgi:glycosyltransferase involved in cell wall biosynthesis
MIFDHIKVDPVSKEPKCIAYITEMFPALTQTFVYRELFAVRERGVPIHPFSIWRPEPDSLSAEAISLRDETFYIFPRRWLSVLFLQFRFLCGRPRRYFGTLALILSQPGESLRNRWRSLLHFFYGMVAIREMQRLEIRHVHAHFGWSASSIALIANRLLDIPFSLTLHAHGVFLNPLLLRAKVKYSQFVVTISEYNRQYLKNLFPEYRLEDKIHVVHCGLDPEIFTPSSDPKQEGDQFTIVGIGQLDPRKGFHVLIDACHHLATKGIPFRCQILGEGQERNRLEALISRYKLMDHVYLPGKIYQEELRQILNQADVSVLPCVRDESGELDGIPVALMETMAMQIPTVSTRISGIPELIDHGRNGWLTPPGDSVALADALQHLRDNPELRIRVGKAARQSVVNEFNIYKSAEAMAALFEHARVSSQTQQAESK